MDMFVDILFKLHITFLLFFIISWIILMINESIYESSYKDIDEKDFTLYERICFYVWGCSGIGIIVGIIIRLIVAIWFNK